VIKVGDRLAALLVHHGVDRVFGLPGGQTLPLYDGIFKLKGRMEHVLMRDERSAGFAADAYARLTGRVGVCDATVGPGATNLVSPVAEAYCASIPLLAIISDIPRAWEHRRERGNASQAIRQLDLFRSISKWQATVVDPSALDDMIAAAFRIAVTGRPGPVVLSVPDDVAQAESAFGSLTDSEPGAIFPRFRTAPDPERVRQVCTALKNAERPLLVAGGGVHLSNAGSLLRRLAEQLNIPVVTSISGKGVIETHHRLAGDVAGTFGNPIANALLSNADLVFFVGCKIGQLTTLRYQRPQPGVSIIHLDFDPEELGRHFQHCIPLSADAKLGLEAVLEALGPVPIHNGWTPGEWQERYRRWYRDRTRAASIASGPLKPPAVMAVINQHTTDTDLMVCDASLASGWAAAYWQIRTPGQRMIAPRGLATLGWGVPAAIGAALAFQKQRRILHLTGDGGFGYSIQELETMVRLNLPVVTIVLNNRTLGWIKHIQKNRYQERYLSVDFGPIDFAAVAKGFGAVGHTVETAEQLQECLSRHNQPERPVVIDVAIDPWETPVLEPADG
jgi:acetolactate synthase I/II/III large subunit